MLKIAGLSRSSYYYQTRGQVDVKDDAALAKTLTALAGRHPTFGVRRLTKYARLVPRWKGLGFKRVARIVKSAGIAVKRRKHTVRTTNSAHGFKRFPNLVKDLDIAHPNQVWVCDITYIILGTGEVVYLAVVMDVFTRVIRGWELGQTCDHLLTLRAIQRALKKGCPQIHHSDQGVQYATPKYTQILSERGVALSMAAVGKAWENGYAERLMRTLKEEEVTLNEYDTYEEACKHLGKFIDAVYNRKRMHSSIGDLSPMQFEQQWRSDQDAKTLS